MEGRPAGLSTGGPGVALRCEPGWVFPDDADCGGRSDGLDGSPTHLGHRDEPCGWRSRRSNAASATAPPRAAHKTTEVSSSTTRFTTGAKGDECALREAAATRRTTRPTSNNETGWPCAAALATTATAPGLPSPPSGACTRSSACSSTFCDPYASLPARSGMEPACARATMRPGLLTNGSSITVSWTKPLQRI